MEFFFIFIKIFSVQLSDSLQLSLPRQQIWNKLHDPQALYTAIPNCEQLLPLNEESFSVRVKFKLGFFSRTLNGKLHFYQSSPPESFSVRAEANDRIAGYGSADVVIRLEENEVGARLYYTAEIYTKGRIAQLGVQLFASNTRKYLNGFFNRLCGTIATT